MSRTLNPLGIRKLDVQAERKTARKEAKQVARRLHGNDNEQWRLETAFLIGWERGVAIGAEATRDRVKEALDNGNLIKP